MVLFAHFDGIQGTVVVPGYLGIPGSESRSVSFWIRTTQRYGAICWWGNDLSTDPEDGEQCQIRLIKGHIEIFGRGSSTRTVSPINDGNFHHVVCIWTSVGLRRGHEDFGRANIIVDAAWATGRRRGGANVRIYPDGTERTSTAIRTVEQEQLVIGARPRGFGDQFTDFFRGDLDEFALYQDVMSSGTISGAYNGGVRGTDLNALGQVPALQLWYRMGDAIGDVAPSGIVSSGTFIDQTVHYGRNAVVSSGVTISG